MVSIRIADVSVRSLEDEQFRTVLALAERTGGTTGYPLLRALADADAETDPAGLLDEIVRLSASADSPEAAVLLGQLRDDLLEAVSVASEG